MQVGVNVARGPPVLTVPGLPTNSTHSVISCVLDFYLTKSIEFRQKTFDLATRGESYCHAHPIPSVLVQIYHDFDQH